ncbi:MAG TPA: DUF5077 domain-containing protein [Phnomibacter sp.]|nr:DUF5077 domain-containing protein [Phnomibacter sp.]
MSNVRIISLWLIILVGCSKKAITGTKPDAGLKEITGVAVPLGGNAYMVDMPAGAADKITNAGTEKWQTASGYLDVYVRFQKAGLYNLGLRMMVPDGNTTLEATAAGKQFTLKASNREFKQYELGSITITNPGYERIRIKGVERTGAVYAVVTDVIVSGAASNLLFANDKDNFYWSRRGPSVHMTYALPAGNWEYAYNEVEVPVGQDKPGTFFMANGFGQGYFGIQSKQGERWVIFSVWDPANGVTQPVTNGANVVVQRFGGEGTGGQSYMLYDWKPGVTYKFITRVRPDGQGNSLFSAWFFDPAVNHWFFMATWKRPGISTWQSGFHSFLENFYDYGGYMSREALYKNQWVRSADGNWTELTNGKHTVDATGRNQQRLDFAGGLKNGAFWLKMGGYFNETVNPDAIYSRTPGGTAPQVEVQQLPGNQ